jgi:hypothetical protein
MYPSTQDNPKNHTQLFSVVGSAYIPEDRADPGLHEAKLEKAHESDAAVAGLWLAFYGAVIVIGTLTSAGAAKLVRLAASIIK